MALASALRTVTFSHDGRLLGGHGPCIVPRQTLADGGARRRRPTATTTTAATATAFVKARSPATAASASVRVSVRPSVDAVDVTQVWSALADARASPTSGHSDRRLVLNLVGSEIQWERERERERDGRSSVFLLPIASCPCAIAVATAKKSTRIPKKNIKWSTSRPLAEQVVDFDASIACYLVFFAFLPVKTTTRCWRFP